MELSHYITIVLKQVTHPQTGNTVHFEVNLDGRGRVTNMGSNKVTFDVNLAKDSTDDLLKGLEGKLTNE